MLPTKGGTYLGVFDGHGDTVCAEYCALKMPAILTMDSDIQEALATLNSVTRTMHSGSTASIVFIPTEGDFVRIAVIGDSPVIVKRKDGSLWQSPEHNVRSNQTEAAAARERGGIIMGGYMYAEYSSIASGLQMTRALGDAELDSVLLRTPEVFTHELGPDSFVLVCTDGMIDPAHENTEDAINNIVSMVNDGADAQGLVDYALGIHTGDNVTAILWRAQ